MTVGITVLVASALVIFTFGVLIGHSLSERQLAVRARRQAAAQSSLYRQLHALQAARQNDYPDRTRREYPAQRKAGSFS
jgi:hypothetical protein